MYVVHLVEGTVCLSKIIAKPDGLAELKINIIMIRIIVESLMNRFAKFYAIKIYGGNIMQNFPRVVYIITTNLKFKFSCKKRETKFVSKSTQEVENNVPLNSLFELFRYLNRLPRCKHSKFP